MNRGLLVAAAVLLSVTVTFGQIAKQRLSADGVAFPPAAPERQVKVPAPLIGETLGLRPDDVPGVRWLSANKSAASLERLPLSLSRPEEWFSPSAFGSHGCGINLVNGRIQLLRLAWRPRRGKVESILREVKKAGGLKDPGPQSERYVIPGDFRVRVWAGESPRGVVATIEAHPVDWHLAHNDVPEAIAKAMKDGQLARGMTAEQADLSLEKKPDFTTTRDSAVQYEWVWVEGFVSGPNGRIVNPGFVRRRITATLEGGRVTSFAEEKVN